MKLIPYIILIAGHGISAQANPMVWRDFWRAPPSAVNFAKTAEVEITAAVDSNTPSIRTGGGEGEGACGGMHPTTNIFLNDWPKKIAFYLLVDYVDYTEEDRSN